MRASPRTARSTLAGWRRSVGRERGNVLFRALDRYVGVPAVAALGLVSRERPRPATMHRIGLINGGAIGDTVILSAIARDIADAHPGSETLLFTSGGMIPVLQQLPQLVPVPIKLASPRDAVATLRQAHLDVLVDFTPWPRLTSLYAFSAGASFTAGFATKGQFRHYLYDVHVDHSQNVHELENYRSLARVLGVESTSMPTFQAPGKLSAHQRPDGRYAVLHPWPTGIQSHVKEWPYARWTTIIAELSRRGLTVVLTGGPDDVARSAAFAASQQTSVAAARIVDRAGCHRLDEMLDLVVGSSCVVSVNTGIAHLAAATGAPTITLDGPTSARRWGPKGPRAIDIESDLPGCGFLDLGWEYRGQRADCMQGVSTERVLEVLDQIIAVDE